jgi:rhodanese-related sulfurtransferase
MNQKGIPGTYALLGGPAAWKAAGYPVERSASEPGQ